MDGCGINGICAFIHIFLAFKFTFRTDQEWKESKG